MLELVSTSFIAGFTIVFGVVALGIVEAFVEPTLGHVAKVAGALAFGIGLVFLVAGRTELFNENFADPTAAAVERSGFSAVPALVRLWVVTFVVNLVGACLFALVFAIEGAIPPESVEILRTIAEDTAARASMAWFARGIAGGALVALLSFLIVAVRSDGSKLSLTYAVGFMLALGPFDHVIVSITHVVLGIYLGAPIGLGALGTMSVVVTAGNLVGGLGLVTLTHVTQGMGAEESEE